MVTIDILKEFGANTEEALARCLDNEEFYLRLVDMGVHDEKYDQLGEQLRAGDLDNAFETCHALKGVLANLALGPIGDVADEMTELLRSRTEADYLSLYSRLIEERQRLLSMMD